MYMINYRSNRTRLTQGRYCSWHDEGSWTYQPVAYHHDHIYIHTKIPDKLWTDYFVAVDLYPHHFLSFSGWIKKIAPAINTGETEYFRNHEGDYYDAIPYFWKNITVIKIIGVIYVIESFAAEIPHGKSPRTKQKYLSLICFFSLTKSPR